jgi:superfamily II RNA helicase
MLTPLSPLAAAVKGGGGGPNSGGMRGERQQLMELVNMLTKRQMLPTAVFCFSKKRCAPRTASATTRRPAPCTGNMP